MTNDILTSTLAAMLLWIVAGCTEDDAASHLSAQQEERDIVFSTATIGGGFMTRSDAADTYNDALTASQDIGVYIYGYETEGASTGYDISQYQPAESTASETWVYQTVGDAVTVSGGKESNLILLTTANHTKAPRFPRKVSDANSDMHHVDVFAVFPNNTSFVPSGTSYTFTVDLDQTDEEKIKAADLLTNDKVSYTKAACEGQSLQLQLKHRMAKLHVTFVPKAGSDLTAANMPTDFKVLGVRRSVIVNPMAGTVVRDDTQAATTDGAPMLATASQSFFIPPQTINAGAAFLKFDIKANADGKFKGIAGCSFAPTLAVNFEAGKRYELTVTVDVDFVGVTGTITSWNEENLPYDTVVL